ncbi:hypothetical protein F2Q70_00042161 [Brassica cretica]|uniref:TPX2 central domain-containing protein n=1 Tax=Brassica cretica TaxID=69181 RepID=A0A8S9K833_BRACR|nr:hypothetical protein F2Q70_00042161 [Brassica cretica]
MEGTTTIDQTYEFLAPRWFDFVNGETEDEARRAELWFESALSCAPSPSVPRIKARRSFKVEAMCNFNEDAEEEEEEAKKEDVSPIKPSHSSSSKYSDASDKEHIPPQACTPKPLGEDSVSLKKQKTARKIASLLKNPSALRPKGSHQKSVLMIKETSVKKNIAAAATTNLIQDNQAIKRQKLDDGRSRQILNPKPTTLLHKTRQGGLVNTGFNVCPEVTKQTQKENRKVYVREQIKPFISTAELMKKFQTSTHVKASLPQNRTKLTLTRPKEPEFVTSQRARPLRVKSSAELEEEMLAKIPKFKARPVNKKILAAPALPAPQRSTPHLPEFQEFNLETMARANQHAETSSIASTQVSKQHNDWKPHLTAPKPPVLQTMLRARPTKAKTTAELEQEELDKAPKFKAKPLNKKIMEGTTTIDQTYEFLAPRWFDFVNGETEDEARRAELWFESALSCAPSPSVPRIKARRSFKVEAMCNFNEEEEAKKEDVSPIKPSHSSSSKDSDASDKEHIPPQACTPKPLGGDSVSLKKQQTARKIASLLKNPSALRPKGSHQKSVLMIREASVKKSIAAAATTNLIQDNQAIKRQKLDNGRSRQILNPKPTTLLHKTRQGGLVNTGFNVCPEVTKQTQKENRKVHVREQIKPFISTAELMKKFQTSTHAKASLPQNRTNKLTLTRPKEPEFVTSQRARPLRVTSSAELEEEMLAKIPKFKARPVNKKILAAPALPVPQRSTPHLPEFQEFHLETRARANQLAETSSIASTQVSKQHNDWKPHLTAPKPPVLQTMLRALMDLPILKRRPVNESSNTTKASSTASACLSKP